MEESFALNEMQLDVLKEVANIGAGNAATALSELINKKINMKVPQVRIIPFGCLDEVIGGVETLTVGVYMEFKGEIDGTIMFILDSGRHT